MGKQEDDQTDLGSLPGSLPMESLKSSPNPSAGSSGSSVGSRNKKAYAILGETKISINGGLQNGNGVYKGSGEFDASLGPPRTPGPGGGKSGKISPFFEKIDKDLETSEEEEKPPEYKPVPFFKLVNSRFHKNLCFSRFHKFFILAVPILEYPGQDFVGDRGLGCYMWGLHHARHDRPVRRPRERLRHRRHRHFGADLSQPPLML